MKKYNTLYLIICNVLIFSFSLHSMDLNQSMMGFEKKPSSEQLRENLSSLRKTRTTDLQKAKAQAKKTAALIKKTPGKDVSLDTLKKYKNELEEVIVKSRNPKTPQEIAQRKKYEETIEHVTQRIDLLSFIDEEIERMEKLTDYTTLTKTQILDAVEKFLALNRNIQDERSERYKKIDAIVQQLWIASDQKDEQERALALEKLNRQNLEKKLEEERVLMARNRKLQEQAQKLNKIMEERERLNKFHLQQEVRATKAHKGVDEAIKEFDKQQQLAEAQRLAALQQEQTQKERLERNKLLTQAAERERQAEAQRQAELQKQAMLAKQQEVEEKKAQMWVPWLQRNTTIFFRSVQSTVSSWWSWLTGRY